MQESITHNYKAPCDKFTLHIIEVGDEILIKVDKSGSCRSVLFEVIAKLINEIPRDKVINIFKGYACEHAIAGHKSCLDRIAKLLNKK